MEEKQHLNLIWTFFGGRGGFFLSFFFFFVVSTYICILVVSSYVLCNLYTCNLYMHWQDT